MCIQPLFFLKSIILLKFSFLSITRTGKKVFLYPSAWGSIPHIDNGYYSWNAQYKKHPGFIEEFDTTQGGEGYDHESETIADAHSKNKIPQYSTYHLTTNPVKFPSIPRNAPNYRKFFYKIVFLSDPGFMYSFHGFHKKLTRLNFVKTSFVNYKFCRR